MKTCIQCGHQTDSKYCAQCGQNQEVPRLTLGTFFHDFFSRIYGLDGAFPHTLIGLTKNPGLVAREYISGIRGKYVGPVGYYFLIFTIYLLIAQLSDYSLSDYLPKGEGYTDSLMDDPNTERNQRAKELALLVRQKIIGSIQYVHVLLVPFVAMWYGIWFRKSKYNFLEHTVFSFFIHAQAIILNMAGFVIFIFSGWNGLPLIYVLSIIYYSWSMSLFYADRVQIKSILRGLAAYLLAFLTFYVFIACAVVIGIIVSGTHL